KTDCRELECGGPHIRARGTGRRTICRQLSEPVRARANFDLPVSKSLLVILVEQTLAQLRQCPGAMADRVFDGLAQFGKRPLLTLRNEQWIVAKTALTSCLEADAPFAHALE